MPGFVVDNECVAFDHRTKSIRKLVQSSLTNSTFIKWQRCCSEALECCESMITNYQVENFFNTCDNHWDGTSCFSDTFPDQRVKKLCPHQMMKHEDSHCPREFFKCVPISKDCLVSENLRRLLFENLSTKWTLELAARLLRLWERASSKPNRPYHNNFLIASHLCSGIADCRNV